MGFFKNIIGDAADELKRNFDEAKKEMLHSVDEMTLGMVSGLSGRTTSSSSSRTSSSNSSRTTANKEVTSASSYEIKNGRLIFRNNGEEYIDDSEKKHISGSFTEIEFPPCFDQLYDDDFKYCKDQLANVIKLDFTKATKIETIGDDTFKGARSLKVVVLPKKVTAINEFKDCPNLVEIHIYKLEDLYAITRDKDKRLVVYASHVSSDIDSFDEGFLSDVGILYVPSNTVKKLEKARDDYDDELDIRSLPNGYTFPTEALSEPWSPTTHDAIHNTASNIVSESPTNVSDEGTFKVKLTDVGRAKLQVVKIVKESLNWGLKESKDVVDSVRPGSPYVFTVDTLVRAKALKANLEKGGCTVTIEKHAPAANSVTSVEAAPLNNNAEKKTITLDDIYGGPQYHCVLAGQSFGPITVRQFANMARFGIVNGNTLVWKNGMGNWAVASTVADLQSVV